MSHAALALRCADRDDAAWRELLELAGPSAESVMRRVFRRAGVPDPSREAADAMGAWALALLARDGALLRAYREDRAPLSVYLAVVARSTAIRILEKRHPHRPLEEAEAPARLLGEEPAVELERLREALARLEPRERLLLQLVYWDAMAPEEVARVLGVQPGSIGSLLTRARAALRFRLGKS